ncbi:MAG TPA: hypothetical protein VEC99_07535 [Clostridia bacterium]|nr:hypothetical protein [Clostridia bacterium]
MPRRRRTLSPNCHGHSVALRRDGPDWDWAGEGAGGGWAWARPLSYPYDAEGVFFGEGAGPIIFA